MNETPYYLAEEHEAAIEAATNILRAYALKHALPCASSLSVDKLRPAVHRIAESFISGSFYECNHRDQIGARDAKRAMRPALTALKSLRKHLEGIGDERWRDWAWVAADVYADSADVRDELSKRNEQIQASIEHTGQDLADQIESAIDVVWSDISALKAIVECAERRWHSVDAALSGGAIATAPSAFRAFVEDIRLEWERQVGDAPPAPKVYPDKLGDDKGGPFVDFTRAILSACKAGVDAKGLGYKIANALTANAKSSRRIA